MEGNYNSTQLLKKKLSIFQNVFNILQKRKFKISQKMRGYKINLPRNEFLKLKLEKINPEN